MNHVGHVLNDYFNRTNPQWRWRCKILITQKNTCLTSCSTNITKNVLEVMCELKIAQLKRANTLCTNGARHAHSLGVSQTHITWFSIVHTQSSWLYLHSLKSQALTQNKNTAHTCLTILADNISKTLHLFDCFPDFGWCIVYALSYCFDLSIRGGILLSPWLH